MAVARQRALDDAEWRRERAMQAGMGLGVEAYNEEKRWATTEAPALDRNRNLSRTLDMKRPSYRQAVAWIADNDGMGDGDALDVETVRGLISVALVSDLFGVARDKVARDVIAYRSKVSEITNEP